MITVSAQVQSGRKSTALDSSAVTINEQPRSHLIVLQTLRLSVLQTLRLSVLQTLRLIVLQTLRLSVLQTLRLSVLQTLRLSVLQTLGLSVLQTLMSRESQQSQFNDSSSLVPRPSGAK